MCWMAQQALQFNKHSLFMTTIVNRQGVSISAAIGEPSSDKTHI